MIAVAMLALYIVTILLLGLLFRHLLDSEDDE